MVVRRHPLLGALGGALIGLGVALLFVMFGVALLGPASFLAVTGFFALLGVIYALVAPAPAPRAGLTRE